MAWAVFRRGVLPPAVAAAVDDSRLGASLVAAEPSQAPSQAHCVPRRGDHFGLLCACRDSRSVSGWLRVTAVVSFRNSCSAWRCRCDFDMYNKPWHNMQL